MHNSDGRTVLRVRLCSLPGRRLAGRGSHGADAAPPAAARRLAGRGRGAQRDAVRDWTCGAGTSPAAAQVRA